jgi:hypothetical protein
MKRKARPAPILAPPAVASPTPAPDEAQLPPLDPTQTGELELDDEQWDGPMQLPPDPLEGPSAETTPADLPRVKAANHAGASQSSAKHLR